MRRIITTVSFLLVLGACSYIPPSQDKARWYAVLENGGPEKSRPVDTNPNVMLLEIKTNSWYPIVGVSGCGGPRQVVLYWVNLVGKGPVYRDPELRIPAPDSYQSQYLGAITVDKGNKKVIIDLQKIISKTGEPLRTEPGPANGTYPIKEWI